MTHLGDDGWCASLNGAMCAVAGEVRSHDGGFSVVLDVAEMIWMPLGGEPL